MTSLNWVTAVLAIVLILAVLQGLHRRFAAESAYVLAKAISLIVGAFAFWLAWKGTNAASHLVVSGQLAHSPQLIQRLIEAWQQAPNVAQVIVFLIVYWLVSGTLNHFLINTFGVVVRLIPKFIGRSRLLGGALGAVVGFLRVILLGAVVFLALQFLSIPALKAQAQGSQPYKWLVKHVYEPYLSPLMKQELPVLAKSALTPVAENINLFAVPTGKAGEERGVLVVPKSIAQLAQQITAKDQTPRAKAYALYEWEIHHIHYDWQKYNDYVYKHKWDQQSPLQTLQTGKGVCADYALLYADMAHAVGLTVQIDEGLGGTSAQDMGSHAWNKVYDPNAKRWITVDTTWGSQQDAWFDVPLSIFNRTHVQQTEILIDGTRN